MAIHLSLSLRKVIFRIRTNTMTNNSVTILETMVNSFTKTDKLMDFAATWGLQESKVRMTNNDSRCLLVQLP